MKFEDLTPFRIRLQFYFTAACLLSAGCATPQLLTSAKTDRSSPIASEWNSWADRHLQDGDLVFMRGDCYILGNTVNFSNAIVDLSGTRFTHIGVIALEENQSYIYDIRNSGCVRTRFGSLLTDPMMHQLAIKRYTMISPDEQSKVVNFCRGVHQRRERFDSHFKLDNGRYYCTEMVEDAYRSVDRPLSDPIRICDFCNYDKGGWKIRMASSLAQVSPTQEVYVPGNDEMGIFANPNLELIIDLPNVKKNRPPTAVDSFTKYSLPGGEWGVQADHHKTGKSHFTPRGEYDPLSNR